MSSFGVVLDTATLFPASLRDTLLRLADEGFYKPYWTEEILEELRRNLVKKNATTEEGALKVLGAMKRYFPEAMIAQESYRPILGSMKNNKKDRHVLAAAVISHSQTIVTPNLKDFPEQALSPFGIEAQPPDTFLIYQFDLYPERVTNIIINQAAVLNKPTMTTSDLLGRLALHVPKFAQVVRENL